MNGNEWRGKLKKGIKRTKTQTSLILSWATFIRLPLVRAPLKPNQPSWISIAFSYFFRQLWCVFLVSLLFSLHFPFYSYSSPLFSIFSCYWNVVVESNSTSSTAGSHCFSRSWVLWVRGLIDRGWRWWGIESRRLKWREDESEDSSVEEWIFSIIVRGACRERMREF